MPLRRYPTINDWSYGQTTENRKFQLDLFKYVKKWIQLDFFKIKTNSIIFIQIN